MKVLLTGWNGRLGSRVVDELGPNNEIVTIGKEKLDRLGHYALDLSTADEAQYKGIVAAERPDIILHLAALVGQRCEADPELAYRINVDATRHLAKAAVSSDIKNFVYCSTAAIYIQTSLEPTTETENIQPNGVYGQTKLAAEAALTDIAPGTNTAFTTFRIFNIYGRGFNDSLVNKLVASTDSQPVTLVGFDNYVRDYIHYRDVLKAIHLAAEKAPAGQHQIYNLASGRVLSNHELVNEIERQGFQPHYIKPPQDELNVSWADITKITQALGFEPHFGLITDLNY